MFAGGGFFQTLFEKWFCIDKNGLGWMFIELLGNWGFTKLFVLFSDFKIIFEKFGLMCLLKLGFLKSLCN